MSMERSHGLEGSQIIANTTTVTPATGYTGWFCIKVITDAVLDTSETVASNVDNIAGLNAISLAAGTHLYGTFTAIKLVSGVVQAFKLKSPVEV